MEPGSVDQIVIKALEEQLNRLREDYDATNQQLGYTAASDRSRLRRQLEAIEAEMTSVEQELNERRQQQESQAIQTLLKILATLDRSVLVQSYRKCLRDEDLDWLDAEPETVQAILSNLQQVRDRPSGYSAVAEFLIHLISDAIVPQSGSNALMKWGEENVENFLGVLKQIKKTQKQRQNQSESYLMIVIRRSDEKSAVRSPKSKYFIDAWFILNSQTYKRESGAGCEPLTISQQALVFDEIAALLPSFLGLCSRYSPSKLVFEVFLPLELLNQAVDRWEFDDGLGFPVPIGCQYEVLVRSYERLAPNYRLYWKQWQDKWKLLEKYAESACPGFASGDCDDLKDLFVKLSAQDTVGLRLAKAPEHTGKGSVFALLLKTATPIALWVRSSFSGLDCQAEMEQVLNCCILQLPTIVKDSRLNALPLPPDKHIGHQLSLLWENPDRLPPGIDYSM